MGKRILFFESDPDFARLVRRRLELLGTTVDVVDDGNVGLQRASSPRPDLILLTIELPQMNGFLVCKKLKKNPETQNIPVVILSSEATEEIFEQHRKLRTRAEDYLRKPIEVDELLGRIRTLVELPEVDVSSVDLSDDAVEIPLEEVEEVEAVAASAPRKKSGKVDDEIEQFAESAFDALVMDPDPVEPTMVAEIPRDVAKMIADNAPIVEERPPPPPTTKSAPPPPPPPPPPPAGDGELTKMRREVDVLRAELDKVREAGGQLDRQKAENARLEREVGELRAKAGKGGGISSREFLDLREALNSKDKEILDLRDQLSARDKQLLELRDKNLSLERERADFEDKILALERSVADATDQVAALTADKEGITKRADDLKARLERSEDKGKKLGGELDAEREGRAADVARLTKERDERVAAAEGDRDRQVAAAQREMEEGLATKSVEHAAAFEELRGEHAQALEQRGEQHAGEIGRLKGEHAREMERLSNEHAEQSAVRSAEAAAEKEAVLEALRSELTTELEERRIRELAQAAADKEAALGSQREELDREHTQARKKLTDQHSQELAVLGRKMAEAETKLSGSLERIEYVEQERDRVRTLTDEQSRELEDIKSQLAARRAEVEALTTISEEQANRLNSLEESERGLRSRVAVAEDKIRGDEELLERARRAFAIGLSLLEDQKNNSGPSAE